MSVTAKILLWCGLGVAGTLALAATPTGVVVLSPADSIVTTEIQRLAVAYVAADFTAVYRRLIDRCELSQEEFRFGLQVSLGCSEEDFGTSCSKCAEVNGWTERFLSSIVVSDRPNDDGARVVIPEHVQAQMAADLDGCASPLEIELWRDRIREIEGAVFDFTKGQIRWQSMCKKAWSLMTVYDDLEMTRQSSAEHSCAVIASPKGGSVEIQLTFLNGFVRRASLWEATVRVWSGDTSYVEVCGGGFRVSELEPGDTYTVRKVIRLEEAVEIDRCEVIGWELHPESRAVPKQYR